MSIPADALHVGQWVVIEWAVVEEEQASPTLFGLPFRQANRGDDIQVDGRPLKILGISLPFLAVTDGKQRFPVDLRECGVRLAHRKYVEAMLVDRQSDLVARQTDKTNKHTCPICGGCMVERLVAGSGRGWRLVCKQCGGEAGPSQDSERV